MVIEPFFGAELIHSCAEVLDKERWTKMSIINCANSGKFSTDRTISEYNNELWKLTPVSIAK